MPESQAILYALLSETTYSIYNYVLLLHLSDEWMEFQKNEVIAQWLITSQWRSQDSSVWFLLGHTASTAGC